VSLAAVRTHLGHMLAKLEVRDRAQLVIIAYDTSAHRSAEGSLLHPEAACRCAAQR